MVSAVNEVSVIGCAIGGIQQCAKVKFFVGYYIDFNDIYRFKSSYNHCHVNRWNLL